MFSSEVDHEKYPDVVQKYRFERVEPGDWEKHVEQASAWEDTGAASDVDCDGAEKFPDTAGYRKCEEVQTQENIAQGTAQITEDSRTVENQADESKAQINPKVLEFLDTEDFDERYNILVSLRDELDDQMVNILAVALDVVIPEGRIEERYDALKNCLRTRQRYESTRLR